MDLIRFRCAGCGAEWDVWGEIVGSYAEAMPLEPGGMAFRLRDGGVLVIEGGFEAAMCPECLVVGVEA